MSKSTRVGIVSLGCPKNQCDAELMLAKIIAAGYEIVDEPGKAEVVIINTCGFIQSAKEEAIEEILEAVSRKKDGEKDKSGLNKKIIVTGCLPERYRDEIEKEFPEIDGILSIGASQQVVEAINTVLSDKKAVMLPDNTKHNMEGERVLSTLPHYAYLRIADGCDNNCSYCAIPIIRGKFRSRKLENILDEAENLVRQGVKELVLIAQDTTRYGLDIYGRLALPELLEKLCELEGVKWLRLLYCYPQNITDELINVIKNREKVVKYLDIPIQHSNREILAAMNRKDTPQQLSELFSKLRRDIPSIILRTTVIVGFPGESEEQFNELCEFVNDVKFEHLGCFPYSQEEGTSAARLPEQTDESERLARADIINEQQAIRAAAFFSTLVGKEYEIVVEGYDRYLSMFFGRGYMFAPEIDGMVYFKADKLSGGNLKIGDFVKVKITDSLENNLIGEIV
ncbi:MAG: 30S ribosomal protein S12 methylthiotransferase RimO [Oscillospiraceae bacterium]|nr:30S ribosomal protein S12 methylthiotransferase RimO [Oscillospiraceae bacterium]